jgi:hypothetical protein
MLLRGSTDLVCESVPCCLAGDAERDRDPVPAPALGACRGNALGDKVFALADLISRRFGLSCSVGSSTVEAKQAQCTLLLEIERTCRWRLNLADPPTQLCHLGSHPLLRQHADRERKGHRANVVSPLDRQAERHSGQVGLAVLPVTAGPAGVRPSGTSPAGAVSYRREQP